VHVLYLVNDWNLKVEPWLKLSVEFLETMQHYCELLPDDHSETKVLECVSVAFRDVV